MPTPLFALLKDQINQHGPLSVADYMTQCLMHPRHGYYQHQQVFGSDGDFITAPDISQLFGEMIGLWLVDRWQAMGCPDPVALVELGPGRGALMADILRITKSVPAFHSAVHLHMVEQSLKLRKKQKQIVAEYNLPLTHHNSLSDMAVTMPALIIGNEFIDALPVHQYQKKDGVWYERVVALAKDENSLTLALTPAGPQLMLIDENLRNTAKQDDIAEVCPAALSTVAGITDLLSAGGGACLLVDYGYSAHSVGDSFQALKNHAYTGPLQEPGRADLTAHVNFRALADAAAEKGLVVLGPKDQGGFLMDLGAGQRAMQLAAGKDQAAQEKLLADLKRLTAPDQMGVLFKVLALQSPSLPPAAGF